MGDRQFAVEGFVQLGGEGDPRCVGAAGGDPLLERFAEEYGGEALFGSEWVFHEGGRYTRRWSFTTLLLEKSWGRGSTLRIYAHWVPAKDGPIAELLGAAIDEAMGQSRA